MVDSRPRIAELSLHGPVDRPGGGMARRLIASLVLVACLLGIVQPALACANSASRTDCCPAGSLAGAGEQMRPASASIEAYSCCALPEAISPSVSAVRARTAQGPASGSPAAAALPALVPVAQHFAVPTPPASIAYRVNGSQTYLRTARL